MTESLSPEAEGVETPATDAIAHESRFVNNPRDHIRSFVLRQGRMSVAQTRHMEETLPRVGVSYQATPVDWDATFGRQAPRILEIGFGMGDATAKIAALRPQDDFIGVEVHGPGVGSLCKLIDDNRLSNLRIVQHDAVEVVRDMIAESSLAGIHVFFPDPWPKKRHHKRRLLQLPFVELLTSRLAPGGYFHCATDWEEYAYQMVEVLSQEPRLQNTAQPDANGFAERPSYRPLTKFENRGLKLGHGVWDVVFRRV